MPPTTMYTIPAEDSTTSVTPAAVLVPMDVEPGTSSKIPMINDTMVAIAEMIIAITSVHVEAMVLYLVYSFQLF